jgi:hypothetical protein
VRQRHPPLAWATPSHDAFGEVFGRRFGSLSGKRRSFMVGRSRKLQTHCTARSPYPLSPAGVPYFAWTQSRCKRSGRNGGTAAVSTHPSPAGVHGRTALPGPESRHSGLLSNILVRATQKHHQLIEQIDDVKR